MAAFYANENFPRRVVELLRVLGHDVLTTQDSGNAGQAIPDEDVLEFATQNQRAVITLNRRDFIRLHQVNPNHWGIVVCKVDSDNAELAARIHEAVKPFATLSGQLIRINRPWNPG